MSSGDMTPSRIRTDLVKCGEDVIGELDFGNRSVAHRGKSDAKTRDSLFRERGVEDPLPACKRWR